jgi:hypothetical protein
MATPTHTHFCWRCHGYGRGNADASGWWRCNKRPCVKPREELCRQHREQARRLARVAVR